MKKTSLVAWHFLIYGLAGLFLFVVLNKEQPPKEGCLQCQVDNILAIPVGDRNLSYGERMDLINNPVSKHKGILDESCVLINFLGGGYEHTNLENVNRFTECCRPSHYTGEWIKYGGDVAEWDALQEEIEIAEKALDEEIKKLNEKIARLKE